MRIFNIEDAQSGYGKQTRNLVVYKEESLEEKIYWSEHGILALEEADLKEYGKYIDGLESVKDELSLPEWLEENDKEYCAKNETYITRNWFQDCKDEGYIFFDLNTDEDFDFEDQEFDLVFVYWDGNNWIGKTVEDVTGNSATEVTGDYKTLIKVNSFNWFYDEDGDYREYKTGQYDVYKNEDEEYFIIDSSRYEGTLDYIESITKEELIKKFGEDFAE